MAKSTTTPDDHFRMSVKNFVDTVEEMRNAQSKLALPGKKEIDSVEVKRLENAVDIRIGMIRETLGQLGML